MGVPLFINYQKTSQMTTFCSTIDIISLHNHRYYFHWLKKNHRENNRLHNTTFILSATEPREDEEACHTSMILADYSVWTNENEEGMCRGGQRGVFVGGITDWKR